MQLREKMDMAEISSNLQPSLESRVALREEPPGTPVMYQTWSHLLFLHWEWDPNEIQKTLPPGLYVDTFDGKAFLGVTPFFMNDVRASFLPEIPGTANFLELNVRTYVYDRRGVPGVWFYSLDCNQNLAVWMAKAFYSLPYHSAEMTATERSGIFEYFCQRKGSPEKAEFHYRKLAHSISSTPGSLQFFLVERYLLYAWSKMGDRLYSARVHHAPYESFKAEVSRWDDTMLRLNGFHAHLRPPDYQCMSSPVRVKIFALSPLGEN